MMNYNETLDFLYNSLPQFQRVGAAAYKAGLDNTIALDNHFESPHKSYKTVHIAGTNGKGSTSQIIYESLRAEGNKVGLYTSPHLVDFRERILVDGKMISKEAVVAFVEENMDMIKELKPSFFEMTVAMAFWWFRECAVDWAVIEVGMGGRLDSTNIVEPELSLITNISKDHTQFLGDTLPKIAAEKAGIIKQGVPVVVSQSNQEYDEVFENKAKECGAKLIFAESEPAQPYEPAMKGLCQRYNAQGAVVALRELGVSEEAIKQGVEGAKVRGRWQILGQNPLMVCDTGHNEDGLKLVTEQIKSQKYDKLYIVLGVVSDKDLASVLPLLPSDGYYFFTQPSVPRAMSRERLAADAVAFGLDGEVVENVEMAVQEAQSRAKNRDMIFVGGSTFVVADLLTAENDTLE